MSIRNIRKFYLKFLSAGVCFFGIFGLNNFCNFRYASATQQVQNDNINKIERFRSFLEEYFEKNNGRRINFDKYREEAEKLYNGIKDFLEKYKDVVPENFDNAVKDYIKERRSKQNLKISVLNREDFDNLVSKNPNILKLYLGEWKYRGDDVDNFNNGKEIFSVQNLKNSKFQDKGGEILKASNCEGFVNYFQNSAGPWRLFAKSEFAVDLDDLKIVERKHLEELVEIIKYYHPEEFGFVDEIEKHVNFDRLKDYYLKKYEVNLKKEKVDLEKEANDSAIGTYLTAPNTFFSSYFKYVDDLYKENINYSYFDLCFYNFYNGNMQDAEALKTEIESKINSCEDKISNYRKSAGLESDSDEDYDKELKIFFINKNMAALNNLKLLAAILDYDVLFYAYDMSGELGADKYDPKIIPDERNGDYAILCCKNLNICNEFKVIERDKVINMDTGEKSYEVKSEKKITLN